MNRNPSEPPIDELLEQLKSQLPESLFATVSKKFLALQYAELKIQVLEERLRLKRIEMYGPGSEKLTNEQLELLELEPGVSTAEVQAESAREPLPARPAEKRVRNHPGRQALPAELPRVERVISCTAEQCVCGGCGRETTVIGYEESEQLDVEPAKYFVVVTKREKRACKRCEERGVLAAPLPPRIIEKSLVSDRMVVDTVVSKYADHCPLYRQSAMLERDSGVELSRQTLDGWVMRVGELLVPLADALRQELLRGSYLQADETPVGVQMHDGNGSNHLAYLWQYGQPHGAVVFDFRMGRGREGPKHFLGNFDGLLQSDGYAVYDSVGGPKMVHACCWSHARRKFVEAVKLHPQDVEAVRIVRLIDELFAIDAEARMANLDHAARHVRRRKRAPALLEEIKAAVTAARATSLPSSALGKAANYTLALWPKLTLFLEYPELELSNNLAENSMRPVAIGRKNWIHIGSQQAGPKVAAILSVVETCRRRDIPVREYLAAVLPDLAETPIHHLPKLTPIAWASQNR
ncbi:MAG TPA: IS66 family transposase [Candidatus Binatia bacterium]|nr:IS66 family transposase [Candidatus Binatia bacterium]